MVQLVQLVLKQILIGKLILLLILILFHYFKLGLEKRSWLCPLFQMWQQEVRAMEKLEGNLVKEVFNNSEDQNAIVIGGVKEVEVKVRGTLRRNVKA